MQPKQRPSSVSPVTGRHYGAALCFSLLLGLPAALQAAPHIPGSESEVLEVLPTQLRGNNGPISRLRAQWRANPQDTATVAALAHLYIETGREQADPRYYGYAEALLQPWWQQAEPPTDIQLLRAIIRQYQHEYDAALDDLQQIVKRNPNQVQAWLTLATVQWVRGDYPAARKDCSALAMQSSTWLSALCHSQVMSLTGDAERAYRLQTTLLPQLGQDQGELRQWLQTLLAETAWRLGKLAEADQHFSAAISEPRRDDYLLRVYSNFLLSQNRPQEVIKLLQDKSGDDALLLRLAIASRDAGQTADTARYQQMLEDRYEAARLRGSTLHARDEALYLLEFNGDKAKALQLAQTNWAIQKEPEDTQLLLQAALANQQASAAAPVQAWLASHKQEDFRLQPLLNQLPAKDAS
jgi:predicted Zn-dependent protease